MLAKNNNSGPIVRFENVTKAFGDLVVLRELDFEVAPAEKVTIVGPSGSGKTTILRVLMTLEKPNSGYIWVNGEPLWHREVKGKLVEANEKHLRKVRGSIGMVFQHFNLFPHLTIIENLTLGPIWVRKTPKKEAVETAMYYLEKVHIAEQAKKYPGQLSGGQQQRVAIAVVAVGTYLSHRVVERSQQRFVQAAS